MILMQNKNKFQDDINSQNHHIWNPSLTHDAIALYVLEQL